MGFNSAFKGLIIVDNVYNYLGETCNYNLVSVIPAGTNNNNNNNNSCFVHYLS